MASQERTTIARAPVRILIALGMAVLAAVFCTVPFLRSVESNLYDMRIRLMARSQPVSQDIVVVAIDDESLDRMEPFVGHWPWPRWVHALLLDYCSSASVVGMDILLSERQWQYRETGDPYLVRAMEELGSKVVLASHVDDVPSDRLVPRDLDRMQIQCDPASRVGIRGYSHMLAPYPDLLSTCRSMGDVSMVRDQDGVTRSYQAVVGMGDDVYPSLAVAVLAGHLDVPLQDVTLDGAGTLQVGSHVVNLASDGSFPMMPSESACRVVSAVDVVDSLNAETENRDARLSREDFSGKIVLIGGTATGLHDQHVTSMGTATAGTLVHAQAVNNLLSGNAVRTSPAWVSCLLIGLMALFPVVQRYRQPRRLILMTLGLLILYALFACAVAQFSHVMVPVLAPLIALGLSAMAIGATSWGEERLQCRTMESIDKEKQQFVDRLVHDLKNTMAPIMMSLSMTSDDDLSFWKKEFPEIVSTSANRLMTQVNALIDIRRMQQGRLHLKVEAHPVNDLMETLAKNYEVAVKQTGLRLSVKSSVPDDACIHVDKEVFGRIMANLIWHAIKYADQDSSLDLYITRPQGCVQVDVVNQGRPISQDEQESSFMPFVTGAPSTGKTRIPSTGIGLTFCKLAVEAHGGTFRLVSPVPGSESGVMVRVDVPGGDGDRTRQG